MPYLEKTRGLFHGEVAWIVHVFGDGSLEDKPAEIDEKKSGISVGFYYYYLNFGKHLSSCLWQTPAANIYGWGSGACNRKAAPSFCKKLEEEERPMSGLPSNSTPKSEDHLSQPTWGVDAPQINCPYTKVNCIV